MTIAREVLWTAAHADDAPAALTDAFLDDETLVHSLPDLRRRLRVLSSVVGEVVAAAAADRSSSLPSLIA